MLQGLTTGPEQWQLKTEIIICEVLIKFGMMKEEIECTVLNIR